MGHLGFSFVTPTQRAPPYRAVPALRVRVLYPPPQLFVQVPQSPQLPQVQSIGHFWMLQSRTRFHVNAVHSVPPPHEFHIGTRVSCCVPLPHDSEHVLQSSFHTCGWQWRGCLVHLCWPALFSVQKNV